MNTNHEVEEPQQEQPSKEKSSTPNTVGIAKVLAVLSNNLQGQSGSSASKDGLSISVPASSSEIDPSSEKILFKSPNDAYLPAVTPNADCDGITRLTSASQDGITSNDSPKIKEETSNEGKIIYDEKTNILERKNTFNGSVQTDSETTDSQSESVRSDTKKNITRVSPNGPDESPISIEAEDKKIEDADRIIQNSRNENMSPNSFTDMKVASLKRPFASIDSRDSLESLEPPAIHQRVA